MNASDLPKGQSSESNGDRRPINLPGIYRHGPSGKEVITSDGDEGVIQADAMMQPRWQNTWKRVGDVPSRVEQLAMRKKQALKDAAEAKQSGLDEQAEIDAILKGTDKKENAGKSDKELPAGGESYTPSKPVPEPAAAN